MLYNIVYDARCVLSAKNSSLHRYRMYFRYTIISRRVLDDDNNNPSWHLQIRIHYMYVVKSTATRIRVKAYLCSCGYKSNCFESSESMEAST